jgi:hypothetical protein
VRGVRHRERTADALLDLRERDELRRARDLVAGQMEPLAPAEGEQRVPARVEVDRLPAEDRRMLVGAACPVSRLAGELGGERLRAGQPLDRA